MGAVAWLACHLATRGRRLRAGDVVSTGMTTGVHLVRPGSEARFDFRGAASVTLTVVAARPEE